MLAGAIVAPLGAAGSGDDNPAYAAGPAEPNVETLSLYVCPPWFRDAKFGIRVQWGPQSVPEQGDGYARNFAVAGRRQHEFHRTHFGPPDEVGYDALIARWTAEQFDPDALVRRFAEAGARYVVVLGADEDGFDLWNSSHQPRNAVNLGPKRDVVGAWATAVRAQGLRFGVSEHRPALGEASADAGTVSSWYARVRELVDLHRPELFYSVGRVASERLGWRLMAHLYNRSLEWHGDLTAVYAALSSLDPTIGATGVETIERGSKTAADSRPWQCDTALNDWVYDRDAPMRPTRAVIHELVDVVSKNGNLLLNVPLRGDGSLPGEAATVLDEIGTWLALHGEAIYGTRPWRVTSEGPTETVGGPLGENRTLPYTPEDIRYTSRTWMDGDVEHETVYAIVLGWPGAEEEVVLRAFAAGPGARPIGTVRLLGHDGALRMLRDRDGLHILLPEKAPATSAIVFRID